MSDDLPLTVKWKSVVDFFNCPVCMCQFNHTHVTPCGHRYCEKCIRECIDRHKKCPCCNTALQQDQLIKDHQFDDLVAISSREKESSEKEYFDNLINSATSNPDTQQAQGPLQRILSPVETVLKEHLKNSLASHERYYQELKSEFVKKKQHLETEYTQMKEDLYNQSLGALEISQRMEQLQADFEEQQRSLDDDIARCGRMVADAFDKYLSEHIPNLSILPVTITLSILSKGIQIPDISVKPHDSLEDIKHILRQHMETSGDRILEFGPNVTFLLFGPLAKRSLYEMHRMSSDILELGATHHDITVLPSQCRPILQHNMKPGSEIAVYGLVKCKSDLPKECFVKTFQAEKGLTVDYFSCKECKINWVCRSCMDICHKSHQVVPYIMNHQPTWACCYCPKKKRCTLQGN